MADEVGVQAGVEAVGGVEGVKVLRQTGALFLQTLDKLSQADQGRYTVLTYKPRLVITHTWAFNIFMFYL